MQLNFFEWLNEAAEQFKRNTAKEPDLLFIPLNKYPEYLWQADKLEFDQRQSKTDSNIGSSVSLEYFEREGLRLLVLGFETHHMIKDSFLANSELAHEYFKTQEQYERITD